MRLYGSSQAEPALGSDIDIGQRGLLSLGARSGLRLLTGGDAQSLYDGAAAPTPTGSFDAGSFVNMVYQGGIATSASGAPVLQSTDGTDWTADGLAPSAADPFVVDFAAVSPGDRFKLTYDLGGAGLAFASEPPPETPPTIVFTVDVVSGDLSSWRMFLEDGLGNRAYGGSVQLGSGPGQTIETFPLEEPPDSGEIGLAGGTITSPVIVGLEFVSWDTGPGAAPHTMTVQSVSIDATAAAPVVGEATTSALALSFVPSRFMLDVSYTLQSGSSASTPQVSRDNGLSWTPAPDLKTWTTFAGAAPMSANLLIKLGVNDAVNLGSVINGWSIRLE